MRTIRLTELQFSLLEAFIDQAFSYESVQERLSKVASELMGHEAGTDEEQEAECRLMDDLLTAIYEGVQTRDPI